MPLLFKAITALLEFLSFALMLIRSFTYIHRTAIVRVMRTLHFVILFVSVNMTGGNLSSSACKMHVVVALALSVLCSLIENEYD